MCDVIIALQYVVVPVPLGPSPAHRAVGAVLRVPLRQGVERLSSRLLRNLRFFAK